MHPATLFGQKAWGGTNVDIGYSIAVSSSRNVYTTGFFVDTVDFDPGPGVYNLTSAGGINSDVFMSKLDAGGDIVWAKNMGGTGVDFGRGIALDGSSNVYAVGYFSDTANFGPGAGNDTLSALGNSDIFVAKYDGGDVSIDEISTERQVAVYPNPFSSSTEIVIAMPSTRQKQSQNIQIAIYDLLGKKQDASTPLSMTWGLAMTFRIERGNLPEGLYFFRISSSDGALGSGKLVVQD